METKNNALVFQYHAVGTRVPIGWYWSTSRWVLKIVLDALKA